MNKMLVAVFENEAKAYEGLSALKSLHHNGDISLYASAVISKDINGTLKVATSEEKSPVGTATGLIAGSLIGLLGGPIGFAIGATAGSLMGLTFDVNHDDISVAFADEVTNALGKGKTAVIAEIDEDWTVPVDTKLEALNAIVFRRLRSEVVDQQLERESKAIAAEFKTMNEELKQAREEDKARINAALDRMKKKAQATNDLLKKKIQDIENELNGKVAAMQQQMKDAHEKRKARLQKRIDTTKEEYNARSAKLKEASRLINEALSPKQQAAS